ncbi:TPA: PAS domain-containing protein [Escherichia coli]|uniref:helix-turn-helix transcriptional regulator n=1 Tax=Enterobacteriaceae TaxID=543 RepID=UPI0001E8AAB1|nr:MULTISPECIES: PAS domain-containing protein [Enterobacteriaceae]MEC9515341.1 PAS domain-containing protein [Escherichia coli]EGI24661.1 DNA-binding protein [Escherichia coli TA206]MDZ7324936.1 PAS domain-containing protein [Kosakonia sacchari]MED9234085.1 PAS domain-containing protein [Escherichia coli]MED9293521.1 PAS domain-containing protein [Escherichia coli]
MAIQDDVESYKVSFTTKDREILSLYFRLAEMVADLIGPHCEVVIHSLESLDNSVVKIVNGHHTGRTEGSPITDMGLKMLRLFLQTGEVNSRSYFTRNSRGEILKSTTCVLAGDNKKPVGLFCVNMNLSAPFPDIIRTLIPDMGTVLPINENFGSNVSEIVEKSTEAVMSQVYTDNSVNPKARNKAVVYQLYENGIFELKEATSIVSEKLRISKHAIYKYLREFRNETKEKE